MKLNFENENYLVQKMRLSSASGSLDTRFARITRFINLSLALNFAGLDSC